MSRKRLRNRRKDADQPFRRRLARSLRVRAKLFLRTVRSAPRFFIFIGVTALLSGLAVTSRTIMLRSNHFALQELRISPMSHADANAIISRAGVTPGTSIFAINLDDVQKKVSREPWVESVSVHRELPATLAVEVEERQAVALVALDNLYLADKAGIVFKRASIGEGVGLPVVTGIERQAYLRRPNAAQAQIKQALDIVNAWREKSRPRVGEVHMDHLAGATLYTSQDGVAIVVGAADDTLKERFGQFDRVWRELGKSGERARIIYLNHRTKSERITVKLAQANFAAQSNGPAETHAQEKNGEAR